MPILTAEDVALASAARFLIDGGEVEAARALLACELEIYHNHRGEECIELRGPRASYDVLHDQELLLRCAVDRAFYALGFGGSKMRAQFLFLADSDWRAEFLTAAEGTSIDNQAANATNFIVWNDLRFRSVSEIRVAQALDAAGVAYWPNCKARLGIGIRRNCEADFLVCHKGKFGILEVDGEPFYPPTRTVHDHDRDRLFKDHGILIAEHFDAGDCFENAAGVVKKFLSILEQAR